MAQLRKVSRQISISAAFVAKTPGLLARLTALPEWTLKDTEWKLRIDVLQIVTTEHKNGGPPDTAGTTYADLVAVLEATEREGIPAEYLADAINEGLYLAANAKARPKAKVLIAEMNAKFFAPLTWKSDSNPNGVVPADMMAKYATAAASQTLDAFIKSWFASLG